MTSGIPPAVTSVLLPLPFPMSKLWPPKPGMAHNLLALWF
jgi:hypothetical protein